MLLLRPPMSCEWVGGRVWVGQNDWDLLIANVSE